MRRSAWGRRIAILHHRHESCQPALGFRYTYPRTLAVRQQPCDQVVRYQKIVVLVAVDLRIEVDEVNAARLFLDCTRLVPDRLCGGPCRRLLERTHPEPFRPGVLGLEGRQQCAVPPQPIERTIARAGDSSNVHLVPR